MQIISKISRQKQNPDRYNIYLNEQYAFSVDESTLIQFGLKKGKILDQLEIDEISYSDEIAKAFHYALNYLTYQMRSEYEVKKKLLEKGYGESVVLEAIQKLKKLDFLNDEAYSKALLETKKRIMKKGPRAIKQDLTKKGIRKEIQNQVLGSFTYEEQLKLAKELTEKTIRKNAKKTPSQIKNKVQEMLVRKGYSSTIVGEILNDIQLKRSEEEWEQLIELQGEKIWNRYSRKYMGSELRLKMKQALYQKGFPVDVINTFIEKKETESL